jgi:hypothetical protein
LKENEFLMAKLMEAKANEGEVAAFKGGLRDH